MTLNSQTLMLFKKILIIWPETQDQSRSNLCVMEGCRSHPSLMATEMGFFYIESQLNDVLLLSVFCSCTSVS